MGEPIVIEGPEQSKIDSSRSDGGLPPAIGVRSYQIFRASKAMKTDGLGWTYHHHVDLACWKGKLYVGWNSCEKDEDVWPSHELYATSVDGIAWTEPAELFPQDVSTPLRMYFFHAANGRMLAIAGMRAGTQDTDEDTKGSLVVREIRPDHTLGEVFSLQVTAAVSKHLPMFDSSSDAGFVDACRQLLADTAFLEQQDRGRLLGPRHMRWHDPSAWPGGKVPGNNDKWVFGKAFSFFRRGEANELVGVSKLRFVTTSSDDGKTWTMPVQPSTLISGGAKCWAQKTSDGCYALVYNPSLSARYPLVLLASDDGKTFRNMRVVHGELPRQRYEGKFRSVGPQYVRGISTWSDDGSRAGVDKDAMWLVYSMSKEDLWVTRVALPVKTDEAGTADVAAEDAAGWNIYSPAWAPVTFVEGGIRLEDRDPYDYASATRVLPDCKKVSISFDVTVEQTSDSVDDALEIDVAGKFAAARPIRLRVANHPAGTKLSYAIQADVDTDRYSVTRNGQVVASNVHFIEPCDVLHRITFRTGGYRNTAASSQGNPIDPQTDRPHGPVAYRITNLLIA
jgi:hypothetical protein